MKKFINKYKIHFFFFGLALVIAIVMALFEIQVEGAHGWAADLPTWKVKVYFPILGLNGDHRKTVTGYHLYFWTLAYLLMHVGFLFEKWTWKRELYLASFFLFLMNFEGLLWFVLNPAWGWHNFRYGIPWYYELWIFGLPSEYWLKFGVATVLYYFSQKDGDPKIKIK